MNDYEGINHVLILLSVLFGYVLLNILIKGTKNKKYSEEAKKREDVERKQRSSEKLAQEKMRENLNEEESIKWRAVALDSIWLRQVKILNNSIYYIPLDENSCYKRIRQTVNSKTKYDRAQFSDLLKCYLKENQSEVLSILSNLDKNRDTVKYYQQQFDALKSVATEEKCRVVRIGLDEYRSIEKQLVLREKRNFSYPSYQIECIIRFISPKGRNKYERRCVFYEEQVRMAIEELDKIQETQFNAYDEVTRRKHERARVTPSVRYNIMKRDGFRCCLCGRSAADGIELEVDHIVPISKGGNTVYSNLQTLCRDCNRGKGTKE